MCVGIIGRVVRTLDQQRQLVEADIDGARRTVNAALLGADRLPAGTYILITAGLAVEVLAEQDALEQLRLLKEFEDSFEDLVQPEAPARP